MNSLKINRFVSRSLILIAIIFVPQYVVAFQMDSTASVGDKVVVIAAAEAIVLGHSAISYINYGDKYLGTVFGVGGLGFLTWGVLESMKSTTTCNDRKSIAALVIPFSIGFGALSYYNFRYGDDHSGTRRLWTNAAGYNVALLTTILSIALTEKFTVDSKKEVAFYFRDNRMGLVINF